MNQHGTDLLLIDDDIVFTAEGDVEVVSGAAIVAQDIDQTLKTGFGALYWDTSLGSTLPLMLNDSLADDNAILAELERVATDDTRVDPESVQAYRLSPGKFRLEFAPLGTVAPETLDYDLTKGRND